MMGVCYTLCNMFEKRLLQNRLACSNGLKLEDLLVGCAEYDSRHSTLLPEDIIEVQGGVYHVELPKSLNYIASSALSYVNEYHGPDRLQRYLKFIRKNFVKDYTEKFDYKAYCGKVLNMDRMISMDCMNSTDATILLSAILNLDPEIKNAGFKSFCVAGERLQSGKLYSTLGIKLKSSSNTILILPSTGEIKYVMKKVLPASLSGTHLSAYESLEDGRLLMIAHVNKIYRKRSTN